MILIDAIVFGLAISGLQSLILMLLKLKVNWMLWLRLILPMSIFIGIGLAYYGVLSWLGKLISS